MDVTDPASAARRVAVRFEAAKRAGHTDIALRVDEVQALLPLLAAAAAGPSADRVERWARFLARQHFDRKQWVVACTRVEWLTHIVDEQWQRWAPEARAAVALADAERAAAVSEGWRAYEAALLVFQRAANAVWTSNKKTEAAAVIALTKSRAALDAAVRRLAGVPHV